MLVAKLKNGRYFSLANEYSKATLQKLRKTTSFYCPICDSLLVMKLGTTKQWHFAHQKGRTCTQQFENETDYHLKGKLLLYQWARSKKEIEIVLLERYIKSIQQRPDILLKVRNKWLAIEFQCSPLSPILHLKRTSAYERINITPIWVVGGNRLKRRGKTTFSLSDFEWSSLHPNAYPHQPTISYFCPDSRRFILLENVIAYSPSRAYANLKTFPVERYTFDQFNNERPSLPYDFQRWLVIKKLLRYEHYRFLNEAQQFFVQFSFTHGTYPSLFPAEAGWPTHYHHWIRTPPHIWQSWILLEFLRSQPFNQPFSFQQLVVSFRSVTPIFKTRYLSKANGHYSFALMSYLLFLCKLNIIERRSKSSFVRLNDCTIATTLEEAIKKDAEVVQKLMYTSRS